MKIIIRLNILIFINLKKAVFCIYGVKKIDFLNKVMSRQFSEILHFNNSSVRSRSNDELRLFQRCIWNISTIISLSKMDILRTSLQVFMFLFLHLSLKKYIFLSEGSLLHLCFLYLFVLSRTKCSSFFSLKRNIVNHKY